MKIHNRRSRKTQLFPFLLELVLWLIVVCFQLWCQHKPKKVIVQFKFINTFLSFVVFVWDSWKFQILFSLSYAAFFLGNLESIEIRNSILQSFHNLENVLTLNFELIGQEAIKPRTYVFLSIAPSYNSTIEKRIFLSPMPSTVKLDLTKIWSVKIGTNLNQFLCW